MSLIPSESYSFPDNYSPVAARRSRVAKKRETAPRPVNRLESVVLPPPVTVDKNIHPVASPVETNRVDPSPQTDAEKFLQAFGMIAGAPATPAPQQDEVRSPLPMSLETNVEPPTPPAGQQMFLQALGRLVDPPGAPQMPAQGQQDVLPPPPMSLETNVTPSAPPTGQEMFLQALGQLVEPPVAPPPPVETTPELPRIPMAPRKVRPVSPPPAADDISMSTANGHGRPRNLRPKTPVHALRYLAVAPVRNVEPKTENRVFQNQTLDAPKSVPGGAESAEQFDFEEAAAAPYLRQRRRKKLARFFLLEFMALAVLVPSAGVVLSHELHNPTLVTLMNILTIAAAAAVAIIPIMLFAIGPAFTRDRRM